MLPGGNGVQNLCPCSSAFRAVAHHHPPWSHMCRGGPGKTAHVALRLGNKCPAVFLFSAIKCMVEKGDTCDKQDPYSACILTHDLLSDSWLQAPPQTRACWLRIPRLTTSGTLTETKLLPVSSQVLPLTPPPRPLTSIKFLTSLNGCIL